MEQYQKAVQLAGGADMLYKECSTSKSYNMMSAKQVLIKAESNDISDQGQPLLVFNWQRLDVLYRLLLTTNSDHTVITGFKVTRSVLQEVNKGDLKNPIILIEWSKAEEMNCK